MLRSPHSWVMQSSFAAPNTSPALRPPAPGNLHSSCISSSAFSRPPCLDSGTTCLFLWRLHLMTCIYGSSTSFHDRIAQFSLLFGCIRLPIHLLKDILAAPAFWRLSTELRETPACRFLCGPQFSQSWVNTRDPEYRTAGEHVRFCKKPPRSPEATRLPLLQSLKVPGAVFVHSNRCVLVSCVVFTGLSLMTQRRNLSYASLPVYLL